MSCGFCLAGLMVGACLRVCTVYSSLPVRFEFGCRDAGCLRASIFHSVGWVGPWCAQQRGPWARESDGGAQPHYLNLVNNYSIMHSNGSTSHCVFSAASCDPQSLLSHALGMGFCVCVVCDSLRCWGSPSTLESVYIYFKVGVHFTL